VTTGHIPEKGVYRKFRKTNKTNNIIKKYHIKYEKYIGKKFLFLKRNL
jgi:hypothetical protein